MVEQKIKGDLVVGKRYRILEIEPSDNNPTVKVGDVLECAEGKRGHISPEWFADGGTGWWFADYMGSGNGYGTMVSAVEEAVMPERAIGEYQRGRFDLLNEIQALADKFHDNCAYGRPNRHEATWLAVHELRKPFEAMAIAALGEKEGLNV